MRIVFQVVGYSHSGKRRVICDDLTRYDAIEYCRTHEWEQTVDGVIYSLSVEGGERRDRDD